MKTLIEKQNFKKRGRGGRERRGVVKWRENVGSWGECWEGVWDALRRGERLKGTREGDKKSVGEGEKRGCCEIVKEGS